jgi:hypothetical protein
LGALTTARETCRGGGVVDILWVECQRGVVVGVVDVLVGCFGSTRKSKYMGELRLFASEKFAGAAGATRCSFLYR